MSTLLDEEYFVWLYTQVGNPNLKNPSRTHWSLTRQLFTKEFLWFVPNDDNRVEDGKYLRYEFLETNGIESPDSNWMGLGCSMLEMLIGLSRRLSWQSDGEPREWFWELLENIEIAQYNDREYNTDKKIADRIDEVLNRVIWRTYDQDGVGGLFPLMEADKDQRKVEIWYQLSAYLIAEM